MNRDDATLAQATNLAATTASPATRPPPLFPRRWSIMGFGGAVLAAGLQIALIRWLGLLLGLGIPLALSAGVLALIVIAAVGLALSQRGEIETVTWERWFQRATGLVTLYVALVLTCGAGQVLWDLGHTAYLERSLQNRYGFRAKHVMFVRRGQWDLYPVVTHVNAGGRFERAA